jgi:hypothetical protein
MMNRSENLGALSKALAEAQAEMGPVGFDATNPFYKSRYATLGALIAAAKVVMPKHGLSYTQLPISDGERVGITNMLLHESGEWISQDFYLPLAMGSKNLIQEAGKAITYARRYGLAAMFGMYSDEDTDGEGEPTKSKSVSKPAAKSSAAAKNTGPIIKAVSQDKEYDFKSRPYDPDTLRAALAKKADTIGEYNASDKQRNLLGALLSEYFQDDQKRHIVQLWLTGSSSTKDMNGAIVKAMLDWLSPEKASDGSGAYYISETSERELSHVLTSALIDEGQEQLL